MRSYRIYCILILFQFLFFGAGCNFPGSQDEDESKIRSGEKIKFYSNQKKGKWNKQAETHVPEYTVKRKGDSVYIKVTVKFKGSNIPLHYVETILLADKNYKELQKVTFNRGESKPAAIFKLPGNYQGHVYAILKCNLHDMWEKRIEIK